MPKTLTSNGSKFGDGIKHQNSSGEQRHEVLVAQASHRKIHPQAVMIRSL